ncbi:CLUMA_CG012125, isoform A [Clunio marinus]|uniref:CLUMA_CG012125, isoform A n=1 Tax=Clunio marinus TaxID=568069 RepID=A0A1J1IFB9_9DIPT|nr:CLUMA_CG012125, isoform A [Clunio marinus]
MKLKILAEGVQLTSIVLTFYTKGTKKGILVMLSLISVILELVLKHFMNDELDSYDRFFDFSLLLFNVMPFSNSVLEFWQYIEPNNQSSDKSEEHNNNTSEIVIA